MLMRLQISPGMWFWHHFSMLSLFLIPVGIYGFLFCVLEITGKKTAGILVAFVCSNDSS